jgi:FkbM family methyltransferase
MFYSQFSQDRLLYEKVFKHHKKGIFMDIGAHDGVSLNNTLFFERELNWYGVNVEPIRDVYDKLCVNRYKSINLNCAVSDTNGVADFILNVGYTEMLSGLKDSYHPRHNQRLNWELNVKGGSSSLIHVDTRRIESICDEYKITKINYLSIDVEGGEFGVIKSINFDKLFIDVIGFENNYPDSSTVIVDYLNSFGFKRILNDADSDIYMINTESEFYKNIL